MSSAITRSKFSDKHILIATLSANVCLVLLYTFVTSGSKRVADVHAQCPSSFFTDATGTRAIYLVLQRLLPAVEQWRKPATLLPDPNSAEAPATLLVFGPAQPLSRSEARALDNWIAHGGQLILAMPHD
jgi:Domain of unknown function (DUF4350)